MLGLLSKTWRLLLIPLFALGFFLGAYFYFYQGGYDPPPTAVIPLDQITMPTSRLVEFAEMPKIQRGLLLVDGAHSNDFRKEEIITLLTRVADRGFDIEFIGETSRFGGFSFLTLGERLFSLDEKLRQADSFVVILPGDPYAREEVNLIERFVKKGGKLLLIADPSREHSINSLAKSFGLTFQPDFLYNVVEYDLNFMDIFVRNFLADEVTTGLTQIALYAAGSIKTTGAGLALTDGETRSSIAERAETYYPLARGADAHVLALSDLTFMISPQNSVMDNDRLIANIADFLTAGDRTFDLADFPYFFKDDVDILLGQPSLFDVGTTLKTRLSRFQIGSELRGVEDLNKDTVYLGLYRDSADVVQYLDVAGVEVDDTLRTPFTPDIPAVGTSVIVRHRTREREVLVILGHSRAALVDTLDRLQTGTFRNGLVGDLIGVYRSR